jgi:hypothetical protein
MMHVKQIQEIVDNGQNVEAHDALDQLLAMGPQNTEALKLRAQLFEFEGRFVEEGRTWERVATIDNEDPDAISYLLRRQLEDREHFYFTDDLPGGGRRFLAYPRQLVNTSVIGLMGCIIFLLTTRLTTVYPFLGEPTTMLSLFGIFVLGPWIAILYTYLKGLKAVILTPAGVEVSSRFKQWNYLWSDVEKVCLARTTIEGESSLNLVILPKDRSLTPVEIGLNQGSTPIRARSYLVKDVIKFFGEPEYTTREALGLSHRKTVSF